MLVQTGLLIVLGVGRVRLPRPRTQRRRWEAAGPRVTGTGLAGTGA